MLKGLIAGLVLICFLGLSGCDGSDHEGATDQKTTIDDKAYIDLNERYIEAVNAYADGLSAVESAEAAADIVHAFADKLEEIIEKTQKLPALHSVVGQQVELSEELMLANMRAEEVSERFAFTMIRSMAFMDSPKMAAAMQRLDQTMAGIQ